VVYILNAINSGTRQIDGSTSLPAQLDQLDEFKALFEYLSSILPLQMREQFANDKNRFKQYSLQAAGLNLDYSKNRINQITIKLLCELARARDLPNAIQAMFIGEHINQSENQPALHTALRNFSGDRILVDGKDVMPEVQNTLNRMKKFCWSIRSQQWRGFSNEPFTDVVSIGIGGSYIVPKLASQSLKPYWSKQINCHYLANIEALI